MIDIQLLRNDIEITKEKLASRGFELDAATFQSLENTRKVLQVKTQDLQEKRNSISKEIGIAKSKNENTDALMASVNAISDDLKTGESLDMLIDGGDTCLKRPLHATAVHVH
mgnify:CR=1 FL=1